MCGRSLRGKSRLESSWRRTDRVGDRPGTSSADRNGAGKRPRVASSGVQAGNAPRFLAKKIRGFRLGPARRFPPSPKIHANTHHTSDSPRRRNRTREPGPHEPHQTCSRRLSHDSVGDRRRRERRCHRPRRRNIQRSHFDRREVTPRNPGSAAAKLDASGNDTAIDLSNSDHIRVHWIPDRQCQHSARPHQCVRRRHRGSLRAHGRLRRDGWNRGIRLGSDHDSEQRPRWELQYWHSPRSLYLGRELDHPQEHPPRPLRRRNPRERRAQRHRLEQDRRARRDGNHGRPRQHRHDATPQFHPRADRNRHRRLRPEIVSSTATRSSCPRGKASASRPRRSRASSARTSSTNRSGSVSRSTRTAAFRAAIASATQRVLPFESWASTAPLRASMWITAAPTRSRSMATATSSRTATSTRPATTATTSTAAPTSSRMLDDPCPSSRLRDGRQRQHSHDLQGVGVRHLRSVRRQRRPYDQHLFGLLFPNANIPFNGQD